MCRIFYRRITVGCPQELFLSLPSTRQIYNCSDKRPLYTYAHLILNLVIRHWLSYFLQGVLTDTGLSWPLAASRFFSQENVPYTICNQS